MITNKHYEEFMKIAIEEAKTSLKEGNKGFGAVVAKDDRIIASAHDTEVTDQDSIAHAEINAIRRALKIPISIIFILTEIAFDEVHSFHCASFGELSKIHDILFM